MEDPALLVGIPLAIIGAIGVLLAMSLLAVPAEDTGGEARTVARRGAAGHPDATEYVVIFFILAFITAVEVGLYYVEDFPRNGMIVTLLALSAAKFISVVGWYMHLKFDSKLFRYLFVGGLLLAIAVFTVVLVTMKAGLV